MKKLTSILENKAVDIYAHSPNIQHGEVAEQLGISDKTLMKLRRNPDFWQKVYQEFLVAMECDIPDIVRAMARESKAGNVQAGRLMLEWAGKLNKTLNINISSPFENWLAMEERKQLEPSKEVARCHEVTLADIQDAEVAELQDRTADNSREAVEEEFAQLDRKLIKKKAWLKRRHELYTWSKRVELVGIVPMPPRRPTKGQRLTWEESIVRAEQEQG